MFTMMRGTAALVGALALTFAACSETTEPNPNPPINKPKPTIKTFRAEPSAVARGATARLIYEVTGATSLAFSTEAGQFATPAALSGEVTTPAITADTVFILTATGEGGNTTQRVTVTIDASAVAVVSFNASPRVLAVNDTTTLSWTTAGAKTIRLLQNDMEILTNSGDRVSAGEEMVRITDRGTTTFRIEATNDAGMRDSREVTVQTAEPVDIRAFTVRPQVFSGASAMVSVSWTTQNATGLSLTANGTAVPGFMSNVGTGTVTVNVTDATRFELTAEGVNGPLVATQIVSRAVTEVEPNDDPATATPLNGGGAQGEITAADLDHFSIMVPAGGNITAQITDGMGGCPFDSVVTLLGPDGSEITSNDDANGTLCSLIDPRRDPSAGDLAAGTYTLVVSGFDETETGMYALVVQVGMGGCGNAIIEASTMEQCDDANTATGDGCDASCRFEIRGRITDRGDMTFNGMLPENGLGVYEVTLTAQSYLAVDTFSPSVGVCTGVDLVAAILDDAGEAIGADDNDGIDDCAAIDPRVDDFALLDPGTYRVVVLTRDGSALPAYAIRIRAFGMGCGNGVVEGAEQCDDGNTASGDRCSATCTIETQGTVMGGTADQTFSGAIGAGDTLHYSVVITAPAYLYAETGVPTVGTCGMMDSDTVLVLTSSTGAQVAFSDDFGGTVCSRIDPAASAMPTPLRPGNYLLAVRAFSMSGVVPAFQVRVRLFGMGCGNGVVEGAEACDDGNTTVDGNGCSATCGFDMSIVQESEPNDTTAQADALPNVRNSTVTVTGGIGAMGTDVDVFSFEVTGQPANLTARTHGRLGLPTSGCPGADTVLTLTNAQGMVLARNDDRIGSAPCSEISMVTTGTSAATLAPGRYFLNVTDFGANTEIPRYFLDVRLR